MVFCPKFGSVSLLNQLTPMLSSKRPLTLPYIGIIDHLDGQSNTMIVSGLLEYANLHLKS
jgi:hypothetical protein